MYTRFRTFLICGGLLAVVVTSGCAVRSEAPRAIAASDARLTAGDELSPVNAGMSAGESAVVAPASFRIDPGGIPGLNVRVNQDATARFQNEPAAAVDPANPQRIAAAWVDNELFDPSSNLQQSRIAHGFSVDGGSTWSSTLASFPEAGNEQTADPALAFDGLGNVYLVFLPYDQFDRGDPALNQVRVAKSSDGGATYAASVLVAAGSVDKPYLAVDPVANAVYVTWVDISTGVSVVWFSRSSDGGATFTAPARVSDPGFEGTGSVPVVGPDGSIAVLWSDLGSRILFDRSTDGGDTWGTDVVVDGSVVLPPSPLEGGFRNPQLPALAVDRTGGVFDGRMYAVWADARSGDPDVLVARSEDGGVTWSAPVRANDDPEGNGVDQFFPWIAVDGAGRVHVTFLDRRDDPDGLRIGSYLATSTDGGASFGPNVRISDGAFPPTDSFYGDYTGSAVSGGTLLPFWPDSRGGDQDLYTEAVDVADFDRDGILNDGDASGQYADNRCAGGASASCDDNCPGEPNPGQADVDGDGIGDLCDNCPDDGNAGQEDGDFDGFGDACDGCPGQPGADAGDPDGDAVSSCTDNCPDDPNADQTDGDLDGIGDACDPCPASEGNDPDGDGVCADVDNCGASYNPLQANADGDGEGNVCDACPDDPSGPFPADADGDGVGDECDCQPLDPGDRPPREVAGLIAFKTAAGARFSWKATGPDDLYSLNRGLLSGLAFGDYGGCLGEGLGSEGLEDPEDPSPGDGFFYVAVSQNFECGLGTLGFGSDEFERLNGNPASCSGQTRTDVHASSEQTVYGSVTQGSLASTTSSNDVVETIREEVTGGSPSTRYTRLEHRWTFDVPAGAVVELHVEFSSSASADGDEFEFEYSTNGIDFTVPRRIGAPAFAQDADRVWELPGDLSGSVVIRVVDTNRVPGSGTFVDSVSVDEAFIRVVP